MTHPSPPTAPHGDARDPRLARLATYDSERQRYEFREELARGGMGAILEVWDRDLRRHLAMKVILGRGGAPSAAPCLAANPTNERPTSRGLR